MKTSLLKTIFAAGALAISASLPAFADEFTVDGLNYMIEEGWKRRVRLTPSGTRD